MADVTALVLVPLDRWRVGGPIYVIGMIDRWAWLAHSPQMCCFYHFYIVVVCWGLLLSIEIGSTWNRLRTDLGPT